MAMLMETLSLELESTTSLEKGFREPSFSSYLSRAEEGFVLSLVKQSCGVKADDDGEIDVFSAEKYFNESLDEEEKPKVDEKPVTVHNPIQTKNQTRALSERSVSSWNSQSALLQKPVKNPSVNGGGKVRGRGYLARSAFRCRCVCSDKNSVAVKEYDRCSDILTQNVKKEAPKKEFRCPVTVEIPCMLDKGLKRETCSISKDTSSIEEDLPLKPRKSLEVFGNLPVRERPNNKPFSFGTEKKLTLNRENEFPSPTETAIPTVVHGSYADSDSDVSSDLFEIEDFTGKANILLSRQMSGNMSGSTTPTAGYAPSEASIAWSVVTASAADVSTISDYEELRSGKNAKNNGTGSTVMNKKATASNDKPKRVSGSFLACKSQDSVKVINQAHRAYEKIPDTKIVMSKDLEAQVFKPEAKLTGYEPGKTNMRLGIHSRAPALPNSRHVSNMLYFK